VLTSFVLVISSRIWFKEYHDDHVRDLGYLNDVSTFEFYPRLISSNYCKLFFYLKKSLNKGHIEVYYARLDDLLKFINSSETSITLISLFKSDFCHIFYA
jgi:hypothetical protein